MVFAVLPFCLAAYGIVALCGNVFCGDSYRGDTASEALWQRRILQIVAVDVLQGDVT